MVTSKIQKAKVSKASQRLISNYKKALRESCWIGSIGGHLTEEEIMKALVSAEEALKRKIEKLEYLEGTCEVLRDYIAANQHKIDSYQPDTRTAKWSRK